MKYTVRCNQCLDNFSIPKKDIYGSDLWAQLQMDKWLVICYQLKPGWTCPKCHKVKRGNRVTIDDIVEANYVIFLGKNEKGNDFRIELLKENVVGILRSSKRKK